MVVDLADLELYEGFYTINTIVVLHVAIFQ